jgi:hypothetical protein
MLPGSVRADAIYDVSIDTAALTSSSSGPFSLDFQFTDGSGTNDGNNTVTLSNFSFGAGSPTGSAATTGTVSGDLTGGFSLTDSDFFNEFTQTFTPGNTLSFTVDLTSNVDAGGVPDEFSFAILDSTGSEIPTLGTFDILLLADIDSSQPTLYGFASDPSRGTVATGESIDLEAPVITSPTSQVPEPSFLLLLASGLSILALRRRSQGDTTARR